MDGILYKDTDIVVCHKKAGIPVQSASVRTMDLYSMLKNELGGEIFIVHRLDQPVEGVLVFARNKRAAAELSRQAADGSMRKLYQAVCEMRPDVKYKTGQDYTLVDYLVKDAGSNRSLVADQKEPGAKRAELSFRILKSKYTGKTRYALAEINLKTGRHHQIRVQMAHAGMPIAGDRKYLLYGETSAGKSSSQKSAAGEEEAEGPLALCATSLTFRHPVKKKSMTYTITPTWSF